MKEQTKDKKALNQVLANLLRGVKETNMKTQSIYSRMEFNKTDEWKVGE